VDALDEREGRTLASSLTVSSCHGENNRGYAFRIAHTQILHFEKRALEIPSCQEIVRIEPKPRPLGTVSRVCCWADSSRRQ